MPSSLFNGPVPNAVRLLVAFVLLFATFGVNAKGPVRFHNWQRKLDLSHANALEKLQNDAPCI
jgi:hypothetical protein